MTGDSFTESEITLIGWAVRGTFHHYGSEALIFSSHSWPVHRISVDNRAARQYINDVVKLYGEHCQAD